MSFSSHRTAEPNFGDNGIFRSRDNNQYSIGRQKRSARKVLIGMLFSVLVAVILGATLAVTLTRTSKTTTITTAATGASKADQLASPWFENHLRILCLAYVTGSPFSLGSVSNIITSASTSEFSPSSVNVMKYLQSRWISHDCSLCDNLERSY